MHWKGSSLLFPMHICDSRRKLVQIKFLKYLWQANFNGFFDVPNCFCVSMTMIVSKWSWYWQPIHFNYWRVCFLMPILQYGEHALCATQYVEQELHQVLYILHHIYRNCTNCSEAATLNGKMFHSPWHIYSVARPCPHFNHVCCIQYTKQTAWYSSQCTVSMNITSCFLLLIRGHCMIQIAHDDGKT